MKTISDYTIFCTSEQTKKALELGAPIDNCPIMFAPEGIPKYERQLRDDRWIAFPCPTTEQMIGWLEDQDIFICSLKTYSSNFISWIIAKDYNSGNLGYFTTHKDAILAAIDAALNELEHLDFCKWKNENNKE